MPAFLPSLAAVCLLRCCRPLASSACLPSPLERPDSRYGPG
jgi:hypothetical protein